MALDRITLTIPVDLVRIAIVAFENQAKTYDSLTKATSKNFWTNQEKETAQNYANHLRNWVNDLQSSRGWISG